MKDEPAFPIPEAFVRNTDLREYEAARNYIGLSKREYFAAIAMQGMCACSTAAEAIQVQQQNIPAGFEKIMSLAAVTIADALIEALQGQGESNG